MSYRRPAGDFPRGVDPVRSLKSLQDIYQRLLLAILEYEGDYYDCRLEPVAKRSLRSDRAA